MCSREHLAVLPVRGMVPFSVYNTQPDREATLVSVSPLLCTPEVNINIVKLVRAKRLVD